MFYIVVLCHVLALPAFDYGNSPIFYYNYYCLLFTVHSLLADHPEVCLSVFEEPVHEVLCSSNRHHPHMLAVPGDQLSSLGHVYFEWSIIVVMMAFINYCFMDPQCTILSLNCYSGPYRNINRIFDSIIIITSLDLCFK